jgi:peroxidase
LNDYLNRYITFVVSRCIVGAKGYDSPDVLETFLKFNDDAIKAMGISSLLPSFLQGLAAISINKDFKTLRKALVPVITKRRQTLS